jgi:hypothetical protein
MYRINPSRPDRAATVWKDPMKRAILICIATASLACGIQPQATTPETYTDFLKLSSQLTCEATLRCCGTLCSPGADAGFYRATPRALDYIAAGQMTYDRQAAVDCLASLQLRYTSCDALVTTLPPSTACSNVLVPKAAAGASCDMSMPVCAPDSVCSNNTCFVRRSLTQSCLQQLGYCTSDSDTCCIACTGSGNCRALAKVGQACTPGSSTTCAPGGYCPTSSPYNCLPSGEQDQTCDPNIAASCNSRSGLVCLTTLRCGTPRPLDSPCTTSPQCASGFCSVPGTTTGTCKQPAPPPTVRQQLCPQR